MSKVLVVDDSPVDQLLAGRLLEKRVDPVYGVEPTGIVVSYAADGNEALRQIGQNPPDMVVTDLQMPDMDGLTLVLHIRGRFPLIPVVLMTAHGSEELAVKALQGGAASYVPKRDLARDLLSTVEMVLDSSRARRSHHRVLECLEQSESRFTLANDPELIPPLVGLLKDNVFRMSGSDETGLIQLTVALREALLNAMEHGNLELDSALRDRDDDSYHRLAQQRRQQPPYCNRKVHVTVCERPHQARYIIRDEGPGFDTSLIPDPTDPANFEKCGGRGLLLMRTFMDEVTHNDQGNEVTLVWHSRNGNENTLRMPA